MKHIIIIGPRSVGKTTIGGILANSLDLKYLDFDEFVDKELNGIDNYIDKYGVDSYRKNEEKILKKFIDKLDTRCVFSLGGGTIASQLQDISKRNSVLVKKNGKIIYLTPNIDDEKSIKKLYSNEIKRKGNKSLDDVRKLYFLRKPIYENLYDIKILTGRKSAKVISDEIVSALKENNKKYNKK